MESWKKQSGWILGILFLISGYCVFLYSHWQEMKPLQQAVQGVALLPSVYLIYEISKKYKMKYTLLHRILLVLTLVSFGVGIAITGTAYNSHAEGYCFMSWCYFPQFGAM